MLKKHTVSTKNKLTLGLLIGAIGVVFGDIGTSPLYALQAAFHLGNLPVDTANVYGLISLIIWSIIAVVTIKYVLLIMRVDNKGEGGIMALLALLAQKKLSRRAKITFVTLGLLGVSLFYGDSVITPAISVLSAVEGITLINSSFSAWVVPITLVALTVLFLIQSRGTGRIGLVFGPIMILWFAVSAIGGLLQLFQHPEVLAALLPTTAGVFIATNPLVAFISLSAVVLAITGAEALYADMGHFGRPAIHRAWFLLVFPSLLLNYLGQGALVAHTPSAISNSYFLLFPEYLHIPIIILATFATLIASQAVISGAFSLTRQALRLGYAPPMVVKHTSNEESGQIYISSLNWLIFIVVAALVITFESSVNLAAAFGMAVSGTLLIDTILFFSVIRLVAKAPWWQVIGAAGLFAVIDILFLASSLSKFVHGGWIPIVIAIACFIVLSTWTKGRAIIARERELMEETLASFVVRLHTGKIQAARVEGTTIYISHHSGRTPLALEATVSRLHEISTRVVIVTIKTLNIPHVAPSKRVIVNHLGYGDDGVSHVTLRFGYKDSPNVPLALSHAVEKKTELDINLEASTYVVSDNRVVIKHNHRMSLPRKWLYSLMLRNATSSVKYLHLPLDRTIEMASYIKL